MSTGNGANGVRKPAIRAPKVGHKKSRKGCQTCKTRRVKCDEVTPECGNCQRLGLDCVYVTPESTRTRPKSMSGEAPSRPIKLSPGAISEDSPPDSNGDLPSQLVSAPPAPDLISEESEQKRYMELRLLHYWMIQVSRPFGMTSPPEWKELWYGEVPQVALDHKNVLYAMFTMTATHMLGRGARDPAIYTARESYWIMALREQTSAVSDLDNCNTDAVAFSALLITLNSLAMLQERSLEPYSPPMDWLEVGRGAFTVLPPPENVADGTGLKILMETTAPIWQAAYSLEADIKKEFGGVLNREIPSADVWDEETTESYETALSYIAAFRRVILSGEAADINLRWICMFPFMVPRKFIDFVGEMRPRALVILAYFFAVIAHTDALQYLGNSADNATAKREIYAIRRVLPEEWLSYMAWPLQEVAVG
ncbi:Zn(2)-C6 fungal-type transcription factor afumD [Fulvia fulva]|uniref:Zn(2)-C6 fungal-type transcription factor afumD n=1 Tax=Passalora fulva TaxID=5499 RepID=A0A9Q8LHA4_PASFU|nr:Zn(2)-C6 fungal-type transcription factor afumD [Fulvia fulva]KAK4624474.1 Zn(2)-C6 fungal-type transcription factor afumD [Fulvia fulva]KAK4626009.1 Zn(2)-C6 fungal-type transcription factor afumD [Fulvia fulva]UJO17422.1 Zn(2)-C6 fungal-type transcription factor afumD [Fulvia fulva]WPV14985.1 Zn(2)-C6 fungal-type transcription factor afumD [Fulvia fulva]WPV29724.1 Zn(2)-C6 fungal-type transcription factor afumD [Fulvia fulva]